jgi:hypothetical protein
MSQDGKRATSNNATTPSNPQEALRQAEAKKSNLMSLYNKGPIQLQTNLANLKDGNGRGRT